MHQFKFTLFFIFLCVYSSFSQEKFTVSGTISDENSNETLIGVTIYIPSLQIATTTNEYGFYSVTLPKGEHIMEVSYVGFETKIETISLEQNLKKSFSLGISNRNLEEVVITETSKSNIRKAEMSVNKLSIETIKKCLLSWAKLMF